MSAMIKVDKGSECAYYRCNIYHIFKKYGFRCDNVLLGRFLRGKGKHKCSM